MAHAQYSVGVFLGNLKPHAVITDAKTQIATSFELFDLPFPTAGVICEGMQDLDSLLAIDRTELLLRAFGPDKLAHIPNSRKTSSCGVPGRFSLRAASTSARS